MVMAIYLNLPAINISPSIYLHSFSYYKIRLTQKSFSDRLFSREHPIEHVEISVNILKIIQHGSTDT